MPYTIGQVRDIIAEHASVRRDDQLNIIDTILHTLGFSMDDDYEHIIYCHHMVHDELSKKTTMDPSMIEKTLISILEIPKIKVEYNVYDDESECDSVVEECESKAKRDHVKKYYNVSRTMQGVHFALTLINTGILMYILKKRIH